MIMENVKFLIDEANKLINRADHLLYITYPLVKDNKIIINIAENVNNGLITAVAPVAAGNIEQALGIAVDSTALLYCTDFDFLQH